MAKELTAIAIKSLTKPGLYRDGKTPGLYVQVSRPEAKSWLYRFQIAGKARAMGLGSAMPGQVSLAEAREMARDARKLARAGIDPIAERHAQRTEAKVEASRSITFRDYAARYIDGKEAGRKSEKHKQQWRNSLRDYAYPHMGHLPIADINTEHVLKALRPIWTEKKETARRVRGRIESILNAAKAEGLRNGENPALWRGHLDQVLARRRKSDVKHHAALPYEEMPEFWKSLSTDTSDAAHMLRWIILTACRFNEAAEMEAAEVKGDLWMLPAHRMKAGVPHTVPLTAGALGQLPFRSVSDVSLAKCIARHTNAAATTHGMRSTFRDWAGDCTSFPREVAEAALAHTLDDKTEAAYRRSTALAKRRELMQAWADYCASAVP